MFFKEERHAAGSKIEVLLYRFLQYRPISKCYNKGVDKIEVGYQSKASEFMKFRRLFAVLEKRNRYGNETPHTRASDSDRKSTRLNSSHANESRMPSSA